MFLFQNYECQTCYRKFKTSSSLVRHNRLHKPEKLEEIKKKYGCEFCGKQFLGSYALNRHINTHTGVVSLEFTLQKYLNKFNYRNCF